MQFRLAPIAHGTGSVLRLTYVKLLSAVVDISEEPLYFLNKPPVDLLHVSSHFRPSADK